MAYNLVITENAENLLDNLVNYLLYELKNQQAASHLLNEVDIVIDRIIDNPYQFAESSDNLLVYGGYREAALTKMRYVVIYYIDGLDVYISGIYHELELYQNKIIN